jgi:adenylate kinase
VAVAVIEKRTADGTTIRISPGPILLLGAPGVGKGTQAKEIMAAWGIPQISTGDILRANVAGGTELGKKAKALMDRGELVPDDLVNEMVADRLRQPDTANGVAVSIKVGYTQLLRRITGRRNCPVCKSIYNIYLQPPKVDELCDLDGTPLARRSDDTEEVFEERMRTYESLTAPVVEHYRALGRFEEVDGEQPVDAVEAAVMAAVLRLRG